MRKSMISIGLLVAVVGLMMLVAPEAWIKLVVIILGISGIVNGIYSLAFARKLIDDRDFKLIITIRGISGIVIGLLAVLLPLFFASVLWVTMIYMLAIYLLISAGMEILEALRLRSAGIQAKSVTIEIVVCIVLAVVLFVLPGTIGKLLISIFGVLCIIGGLGFIIWEWKNRPLVIYAENVSPGELGEIETKEENDE